MTEANPRHLAVLIDAENTSAKIAEALFTEIATIGEAAARRIYGNFTSDQMRSWVDVLQKFAIQPQQHFANTRGKNASDIALVIDAMDLLHTNRFDGFCLVSSDSDFTRLASRIREQGVAVYGFGEEKTPESFRQACTRFIYTENLAPAQSEAGAAPKSRLEPRKAAPLIKAAMADIEDDGGWVTLAEVGQRLRNANPDFDTRTYGFAKLSELIANLGRFEIERAESGGARRIRLRPGS